MPRRTVFAHAADRAINRDRLPNLNYLVEWTHLRTIGRDAFRAIERFVEVTNRVLIVAPDEVLEVIQEFADLLGALDKRRHSDDWQRRWHAARERYARVCREAVR